MFGRVYHLSISLASKDFLPLGVTSSVTCPSVSRSHPNTNPTSTPINLEVRTLASLAFSCCTFLLLPSCMDQCRNQRT